MLIVSLQYIDRQKIFLRSKIANRCARQVGVQVQYFIVLKFLYRSTVIHYWPNVMPVIYYTTRLPHITPPQSVLVTVLLASVGLHSLSVAKK